jgi:HrpA-like RNA helicase
MVKLLNDGMLINEMMFDPFLTNYSVIIVDDIHERPLNTDLLIRLLKMILIL